MTPRERVTAALSRVKPDRCPMQVSITPEFAVRLGDRLAEVLLEQDVVLASAGWANNYYRDLDEYTDDWGVGWRKVEYSTRFGKGFYTEIVGHPLADDKAMESYRPPDPTVAGLYDEPRRIIEEFGGDHYVAGVVVCTLFETAWALRGFERTLVDFVSDPELAGRLLDIPYGYHLSRRKEARGDGRRHDMAWRRRGHADRHDVPARAVEKAFQAAHGGHHRGAQGHEPRPENCVSFRRQHTAHRPGHHRDRRGRAQPRAAGVHGPGEA